MIKKMKKNIGLIILLICIGGGAYGFVEIYQMPSITNNTDLMTLLVAGLGFFAALVGGGISGIGSYFGGIAGALENYELEKEKNRMGARQYYYFLLKTTTEDWSECFKQSFTQGNGKSREYVVQIIQEKFILDDAWFKNLMLLPEFSSAEVKDIVEWMKCLEMIDATKEKIPRSNSSKILILQNTADSINEKMDRVKIIMEKIK